MLSMCLHHPKTFCIIFFADIIIRPKIIPTDFHENHFHICPGKQIHTIHKIHTKFEHRGINKICSIVNFRRRYITTGINVFVCYWRLQEMFDHLSMRYNLFVILRNSQDKLFMPTINAFTFYGIVSCIV